MWRGSAVLRRAVPKNLTLRHADCASQLRHIRPVVYSALPNGFRVACEHIPAHPFVTIGVWIDAGSRFEDLSNNGVAHFLEHLNFKGSKNYTRAQIEDTFEKLGAHFNAYTSRDRTAYYIKVFNKDVDRVLALLSDILKRGNYTPKDVELERPTILAEMREVESLVDEVVMDNLHVTAFDASPTAQDGLSLTILGPVENVAKTIDRQMIQSFVATHYTGPRMMLVSSGGISPDQLHRFADTYFGDLPSHSNRTERHAKYVGGHHVMWNKEMMTTHTAVAFPICGARHPDCIPLQLLHNIVGQYYRERHEQFQFQRYNSTRLPLTPDVEMCKPFFTPYEDVSLLGYHYVTVQPQNEQPARTHTSNSQSQLLRFFLQSVYELAERGPSEALLDEAKCEYKASQMQMIDSTTNSAEDLGRQMLHFGRRVPMVEVFESVDAVTPSSFRDVLRRYVEHTRPSIATIGNPSSVPAFDSCVDQQLRVNATSAGAA